MNMNAKPEQATIPTEPHTKTPRRRGKILLSSFLTLVVLAGAAFSASLLIAQHTPSKAASPSGLTGDIATMQRESRQYLQTIPPGPGSGRFKAGAVASAIPVPPFNNIGISTLKNAADANFDGGGYSYSYSALFESNLEPNLPFAYDGLQFNWSNVSPVSSPTTPDNWQSTGYVLPLSASGAHKVGFIGSAAHGPVSGRAIVAYSDGTIQRMSLGFSDWTLGGGIELPSYGNKIVAAQVKRNSRNGEQSVKTYMFYASLALDATKTPVSVTLPNLVGASQLHIFAYSNTVAPVYAYNNVGMSNDAYTTPGNFDGAGYSYSSAAIDWGTGYTIVYNQNLAGAYGMRFQWPDVLPGTPDNYQANGQTIAVTPVAGATKLGFVGAATGGPSYGTATVNYADGTQQQFTLGFSDWTLNGYTRAPAFGNRYFEGMSYRNSRSGQQKVSAFLFYADVNLQPGKNVTSVTLPSSTNQGKIHVYSISTGIAGFYDSVGVTSDQIMTFGNFDGGNHSYSTQAMQNAGVVFSSANNLHPYRVNGINFYIQSSLSGFPDNWLANGQPIGVTAVTGASTLGFIGSSVNGGSTGTGVITYTDGTTQAYTLGFSDWCAAAPQYNNTVVASMPYRNGAYGQQATKNNLYYAEVPIEVNKTIASVQLPTTSGGLMHIFAVGERVGNYNNIGISNDTATKLANFDGSGHSYSAQALQTAGISAGGTYTHDGFGFKFGTNDGGTTFSGSPNNYVAVGQTIEESLIGAGSPTSVGFILSATGGGASGTATLVYVDGTTQTITLGAPDWCNSAATAQYQVGVAASMSYRNTSTGQQTQTNYLYFATFTLTNPNLAVAKIVLPNASQLHVFSIAYK